MVGLYSSLKNGDRYDCVSASNGNWADSSRDGPQLLKVDTLQVDQPAQTRSPMPIRRRQRWSAAPVLSENARRGMGHEVNGGRGIKLTESSFN